MTFSLFGNRKEQISLGPRKSGDFLGKQKNILSNTQVINSNLLGKRIFSVSEITGYIKNLLRTDKELTDFYLRGEISAPKIQASS